MKVLAILAALLLEASAGLQVRFGASTSLVRLEVSVTDERGSVVGMRAEDFVVQDRGERRSFKLLELSDAPLDVVLVAPPLSSVSLINADQAARVAAGLSAFVQNIEERDRLAVVLAGTPPRLLRPMEPSRPLIGLEAFTGGSYSASFDAIALGLQVFTESDRRRAIVAFTNAADFRSVLTLAAVADRARRLGPAFVMVGTPVKIEERVDVGAQAPSGAPVGDTVAGVVAGTVFPAPLQRLARTTGGVAINLGTADPQLLIEGMFKWLRTHYVLSYELPPGKGWHPVSVKVNRRGAKVVVREGYFVD